MAKSNLAALSSDPVDPNAPYGYKEDGTPRKRPSRAGEKRKQRPIRLVFSVIGPDGEPVQGATIKVHYAGKDTEAYTDACDANPTASRAKVQLSEKEAATE